MLRTVNSLSSHPIAVSSQRSKTSLLRAGIIRRRWAICPDAELFRPVVVRLLLLLVLLPGRALATSLSAEEHYLAKYLISDLGQNRPRGEMVLDPILSAVARARAVDMARRRYVSHVNPDGHGPNYLMRAAGYSLPASWGSNVRDNFVESIGAGYGTPEQAWAGWMKSSSHRSHLLAEKSFYRNQTSYGIGYYSDPESPYRTYWVILTAPPSQRDLADASRARAKNKGVTKIGFHSGSGASLREFRDDLAVGGAASARVDVRVPFRVGRITGDLGGMEQSRPAGVRDQARNTRWRDADDAAKPVGTSFAPRPRVVRVPRLIIASAGP